jgi:hypothetical protein
MTGLRLFAGRCGSDMPAPVGLETKPPQGASGVWRDLLAVMVLLALAALLFRRHIAGQATYIGNPDRLCSHLKILKFHADGLARGRLDAWSDYEMMGYDSFAMPYTFPNILTYLTTWLGTERLYATAGYISACLLALAGACAYAFLRALTGTRRASLVGAILYQFSALSIQKVSQNDMSFAVLAWIPLMALVVLRTGRERPAWRFVQLAVLVFVLLHFMFLQKAAYALLFTGCYALYRSIATRDWRPVVVCAAAILVGVTAAFPRVWEVTTAMNQYSRQVPGVNLRSFQAVYRYQHILPCDVLRWFDDTLFGRYPSESGTTMWNNINLTEGFLLYTSSFVPFLVLLGLFRYRQRWLPLPVAGHQDTRFFFWFFAFGVAVLTIKPVHYLIYLLFLRIDFTHARILVAAVLPLAALVTLLLAGLEPPGLRHLSRRQLAAVGVASAVLAIGAVLGVEAAAHPWKGRWYPLSGWDIPHAPDLPIPIPPTAVQRLRVLPTEFKPLMHEQAVVRVIASGAIVLLLLATLRLARRKPILSGVVYGALVLALPIQAVLLADRKVNGPQTSAPAAAFRDGNNYRGGRDEFATPPEEQCQALARRLELDQYRCVLLRDPTTPWGFPGGHVPEFWRARAVDGYYGLGVPARLAALPWPEGVGLRTMDFPDGRLPWPLLGLLNVKHALVADRALVVNRKADPNTACIVTNPARVVPRCFFARSVQPAGSARDAAQLLFATNKVADVCACSLVEGLAEPQVFAGGDDLCLEGHGDRLTLTFAAADSDRFLVVNELYYPGWQATVDGRLEPIYPSNAVMRGIPVPAGATTVVLTFVPFVRTLGAMLCYGAGLILLAAGALLFRHAATRGAGSLAAVA